MIVDNAKDAVVTMLKLDPVLYGPEIVANVELSRGLYSAENPRHHGKL
jgi:hypothetical protein